MPSRNIPPHWHRDNRMLPATRDIWQGHPASQAWKTDHSKPEQTTDLHYAASHGNVQAAHVRTVVVTRAAHHMPSASLCRVVQALLVRGADCNTTDTAGNTPMHHVAKGDSLFCKASSVCSCSDCVQHSFCLLLAASITAIQLYVDYCSYGCAESKNGHSQCLL